MLLHDLENLRSPVQGVGEFLRDATEQDAHGSAPRLLLLLRRRRVVVAAAAGSALGGRHGSRLAALGFDAAAGREIDGNGDWEGSRQGSSCCLVKCDGQRQRVV